MVFCSTVLVYAVKRRLLTMLCNSNRLVLEVKQGEARSFGFTIKQKGEPMNLTNYQVVVQVKKSPYFKVKSLIEKRVTTELSDDGRIYNAELGQFKITFTESDTTKLPPDDYYLIIFLENGPTKIIISGEGNKSGILRFCKQ